MRITDRITIHGTHGTLTIDRSGQLLAADYDGDGYRDIQRFDSYTGAETEIDILDIGYWLTDGSYEAAARAPDPLDVAFIAVGAAAVYDADKWGAAGTAGQLDYIQQCIEPAGKLYAYLGHHPAVFDTVCYAYEVAEEFGKLYGRTLCDRENISWQEVADQVLAGLLE